jgi:hypothetical protein
MNGGISQVTMTSPDDPLAKADSPAEPRQARLAGEINRIRHQLASPEMLDNPAIYNELQELYKQVWTAQEQRAGRHRLQTQVRPVSQPIRDAAGYDLKPDPLTARTSSELVARLREYREWSGEPPFRMMAEQARQKVAHSTIFGALNSDELPRLKVVMAIIAGCGGGIDDQRAFATAWRRVKSGKLDALPAISPPALRVMPTPPDIDS